LNKSVRYRDDIQVLRGIAVLAVLLFHINAQTFPQGFLGVDIFFVISGFVVTPMIGRIYAKSNHLKSAIPKVLTFYLRRFYRLAPALGTLFIFSSILIFLFSPVQDHQRFARQGIATLLLLGNLGAHRYAGDYFSPNPNPLIHTWSLSVEEQFYLSVPLLLLLFIRIKRLGEILYYFLLLITILSGSFFFFENLLNPIYSYFGFTQIAQLDFYSPISRIWQFAVGAVVYALVTKYASKKAPNTFNFSVVFLMMLLLFVTPIFSLKIHSLLAVFTCAVIIFLGSLNIIPVQIKLLLTWFGNRSYSIYLWHLPVIYLIHFSPLFKDAYRASPVISSLLGIAISLFFGSLSYTLVENRFRYRLGVASIPLIIFISLVLPFSMFLSIDRLAVYSSLDPNLPKLSVTAPWDWDRDCQFFSPQPDINEKPCYYGNGKSRKSILLIGDSHAAADSLPIIQLARSKNLNTYVFTFSACSFILTAVESGSKYELPQLSADCIKHNKDIVGIIQMKKPIAIIWAHRSSSIMVSPNTKESRLFFNQLLLNNISELRQFKIPIIHIGSEPELIPITTWMEKIIGKKANFSQIPFEDNLFWKQSGRTEYYIDTTSIFCPQKVCFNNSNLGWLFEDTNHLSNLGMRRVIPILEANLDEILSKK